MIYNYHTNNLQTIMASSEQLSFHYGEITYFGLIIEEYIKTNPEYSLYTYITNIINTWRRCGIVPHTCWKNNSAGTHNIIKGLDSIYYRKKLVNLYRRDSPKWDLGKCVEKYEENIEFNHWCDRCQKLYDSNRNIRLRSIKNIISPFQRRFQKRLWNPHSKLGYRFGVDKMNKIEW